MSAKDWIILLVPILCNGVIIFILQKIFERKQLITSEKYEYVFIMLKKVDEALSLFIKATQSTGDDIVQNNYLNKFINSYCDIFYYYQQNQKLFKVLKDYMVEIVSEHEKLKKELDTLGNNEISPETKTRVGTGYYRIYELLQSIQNDCINYKV